MNTPTNLRLGRLPAVGLSTALFIASLSSLWAGVGVFTQHNNLGRTGANLRETILTTRNVNTNTFGLLFTRAVDDQIYAQPLIAPGVNIPGKGVRNLVIVATVNDSVYAFDADAAAVTNAYWQVSFLNENVVPPRNTDLTGACGGNYQDFSGNIGIVGTPVIDPATGTIYLVARTLEFGTTFVQKLHALDIRTGAERPNSPVVIDAVCPGNGDGNLIGVIAFDAQKENQRAALALVKGVVYISWASHCDWAPYHGWLLGYDAATLQQVVVYNTTPEGEGGGIWMAGQGLSADGSGNLYVTIGNGTVGNNGNPRDLINRGESFLKLTRNGENLNIASWFTPYNYQELENSDIDLGSAGILLIPNTTLALSGGKEGVLYLVNRDKMGGLSESASDANIVQSFRPASGQHKLYSSPVWWNGPNSAYAYIWLTESDYLRQYKFNRATGKFVLPEFAASQSAAPEGIPGGIMSISANGDQGGSGIVWASHQLEGNANHATRSGILRAFNAQNVARELWNSEQNSARDAVGIFAKFCPPTIANGKVYLATFSNRLNVYGLLKKLSARSNAANPSSKVSD